MIDKNSILKMTKQVLRRGQGYPDRRMMHPRREWAIGLILFTILVLSGAFISSQEYLKYSNLDTLRPQTQTHIVAYNELGVSNALETFRDRKRIYGVLTNKEVVIELVPDTSTSTQATSTEAEVSEETE